MMENDDRHTYTIAMQFSPLHSWMIAFLNATLFLGLGYFTFGRPGLFVTLLGCLVWNSLLLLYRHPDAIEHFKGRIISGRDPWKLRDSLTGLTEKIRVPKVELYLSTAPHPLFMVSTAHWKRPRFLISESTMELLTPTELEALLALGLSTLKQRYRFFRYYLERIALTWISIGCFLDAILPFRELRLVSRLTYLIAWLHLKVAYPSRLQTQADGEAAQVIFHPRDLASALWKLNGALDCKPAAMPESFRHLSLLSPIAAQQNLWQFNLPIESRLRFLVGYYPI